MEHPTYHPFSEVEPNQIFWTSQKVIDMSGCDRQYSMEAGEHRRITDQPCEES